MIPINHPLLTPPSPNTKGEKKIRKEAHFIKLIKMQKTRLSILKLKKPK